MRVVAHEDRHRSDSTNRKLLTAAEAIGRWASFKAGYELAELIPMLAPCATLFGLGTRDFYYRYMAPEEGRAMAEELRLPTFSHRNDITFPLSRRQASEL